MTNAEAQDLLDQISRTQNRLRGRLCGLVESWGLPEKRERAMIGTLKSLSYDLEAELSARVLDMAPEPS